MKRLKLLKNISYLAPVLVLLGRPPVLAQDVEPEAVQPDTDAVPTEQPAESESAVQSTDDAAPLASESSGAAAAATDAAATDVSNSDLSARFDEQQEQLDGQRRQILTPR